MPAPPTPTRLLFALGSTRPPLLAASIFHYAESSVTDLKRHLRTHGIPVRL